MGKELKSFSQLENDCSKNLGIYLFIFNIENVVETLAVRNLESRHYASVVRGHGHLEEWSVQ